MMPAPKAESVRAKGGFLTTEDTPHTATVKMPISGVYEYLSARACEPILTIPITGSREIKYQSHPVINHGVRRSSRIAANVIPARTRKDIAASGTLISGARG